mgnify:CR=1 FL=1
MFLKCLDMTRFQEEIEAHMVTTVAYFHTNALLPSLVEPLPFDISQPPGPGLTVLEASAGTGKTYSITGLALLGFARGEFSPREVCVVTSKVVTVIW